MNPSGKLPPGWRTAYGVGAGLQNVGNSCYVNAVLQCLTYTPPLTESMLSGEHSQSCAHQGNCVMCAMEAHVTRTLRSGHVIQPSRKLTGAFHRSKQEDAHEFLMFTLNAMHESCLAGSKDSGPPSEDRSPIRDIFGGQWSSQIKCLLCHGTSDTFDPYLDITVDIQAAKTVKEALEDLVKPEELRGDNACHCGTCQKKMPASKRLTLYTAPKVLTLVLKRFSCFTGDKVNREVKYPERLDLGPYMSGQNRGPLVYTLYAVLVHSGASCHSGHYFCYCKAGTGQWYKMDDALVTSCDITSALSQHAYILFYVQQTDLQEDTVEVPVGLRSSVLGPECQGQEEQKRELNTSFYKEEEEAGGRLEKTATKELSLDQWKVLQEQNRPKSVLNLRTVDSLPANVVVIHQSKYRGALGKSHPDKENYLWTKPAGHGSENTMQLPGQRGKTRDRKKKSKEGRRPVIVC